MIGQTISHYKILEKLGEGGMGVVYKAHDTLLDRDVALKFLPHQFTTSQVDVARFVQEAKAAASLNHPNICTIYDFQETVDPTGGQKQNFIVMEIVEGKSLREMLPSISFKQAIDIGTQIASGLAAAHKNDIVHRDLKPENIMVRNDGRVLIMDFGLAKLKGSAILTKTHTTVGTARYMSPEQVQGEKVDHRSDIFSLGVVLYELFTGLLPFKGEHEAAVLYEIVNVDPPIPSAYKPEIITELDTLIIECLAKEPEDRCQSSAEINRRLKMIGSSSKATYRKDKATIEKEGIILKAQGTQERDSRKKSIPLVLTIIFFCTTVFFGILFILYPSKIIDLSSERFTPFAGDLEEERQGSWSPDGKSIAYSKMVNGTYQLFIKNVDPNALPVQLTTLGDIARPFWSPSGDLIYFFRGRTFWSIGTTGGEPNKLFENLDVFAAAITRDGNKLGLWASFKFSPGNKVSVRDSSPQLSLLISSPPGSMPQKYEPAPFETNIRLVDASLHFSPDGTTAALSRWQPKGAGAEFWIIPLPGGKGYNPHEVHWQFVFSAPPHFDWCSDSRTIVLDYKGSLWFGDTKTGNRLRITSSIGNDGEPSISQDGKKILFTSGKVDYDIIEVPLNGMKPNVLVGSSFQEFNPSWSSSGDKMVYYTERSGKGAIWLRSQRLDLRPIVTEDDFTDDKTTIIRHVIISPDGKRVAFARSGDKTGSKVWISPIEGGRPTMIPDGETWSLPTWSPDGNKIAIRLTRSGGTVLVMKKLGSQDSATTLCAASRMYTAPVWSPIGDWIAFASPDSIMLVSPNTKQLRGFKSPVPVDRNKYSLTWNRDGSKLFILSSTGDESRLDEVDISSGSTRKIAGYGWSIIFGEVWWNGFLTSLSPGGNSLTTSIIKNNLDIWIMEGFPAPETLW